jgi:UDP-N-acetyl-D-mannosaminuronate dehydrogenase
MNNGKHDLLLPQGRTLVVGLGEVGGALAQVLESSGPILKHDIERVEIEGPIGVMHLCIPFSSQAQYEQAALEYIERFRPALTIINSTVLPGTTRSIGARSGARVAFSPVRGKHVRMVEDLGHYIKFVAAVDPQVASMAVRHFESVGLKPRTMSKVETLELAKLAETTYFGVLIAFAQELNRFAEHLRADYFFAEHLRADYFEATDFFEEVDFLPRTKYFPGFIGGHCVIPNIKLLQQLRDSDLLNAIMKSNDQRAREPGTETISRKGGPAADVGAQES